MRALACSSHHTTSSHKTTPSHRSTSSHKTTPRKGAIIMTVSVVRFVPVYLSEVLAQ
jgi:hypothetical protein